MQSAKNAKESVKEAAANVGASAKSGKDKTKAVAQGKVEKLTAHDPVEKDMATLRKEERVVEAELNKREAYEQNAATRYGQTVNPGYTAVGSKTHTYSTTGVPGHPTEAHQMSALPGHGTGQPTGQVTEGVVPSHPIGINSGTGRTISHNPHVEGTKHAYAPGSGGYCT